MRRKGQHGACGAGGGFGGRRLRRTREDSAAEIDAEIESHFDETVELLSSRGLTREDAWREARRRFGDVELYRGRILRMERNRRRVRVMRDWLSGMGQGVAQAWRGLGREPGFAMVVVVMLALGLGANATMFTVIDRLLLSAPRHVESPEGLRTIYGERVADDGATTMSGSVSWPDVEDLAGVEAFDGVAAWSSGNRLTLGDGDVAEKVNVVMASWRLFPMLGVSAARGRFFGEAEDRGGVPGTVVLSHDLWRSRFGSDPDVLGRELHIGNGWYEVIGIAPPGFTGAELWPVDAWLPLLPAGLAEMGDRWPANRGWQWLQVVARLGPGVSEPIAAEQATAVYAAAWSNVVGDAGAARVLLAPIVRARGPQAAPDAAISKWLGGVSLTVLLIVCANVANLLLARSIRRKLEVAVRLALGSSRARLVAHQLTESAVLAGLAAAGAIVVAVLGGRVLQATLLPDVAFGSLLSARLLVFTSVAAVTAALLSGAVPAVQGTRPDVLPALKDAGGRTVTRGGSRIRLGLVMVQAALSSVLLVGAGLFVLSLANAREVNLGFDASRAVLIRIERGESAGSNAGIAELYRTIEEVLPRLPQVEAAARTASVPMGITLALPVRVPGHDSVPRLPSGTPAVSAAAPDYFRAMGQRVVAGRAFRFEDLAESAELVAIVNEAMAAHVWPDDNPLAQCVRVGGSTSPCARIVGIVETHTLGRIGEDPRMAVWLPVGRGNVRGVHGVVARTAGPPVESLDAIRSSVRAISDGIRFVDMQLLQDPVEGELRSWKLGAGLFGIFGVLALLVAGVGLYGVLAFDVTQRRAELGIRRALGATAGRLVSDILLRGVAVVTVGAAAGLGVALLTAPRVAPLLYGTSPREPLVYLAAGVALVVVAVLASSIPARRTTSVDPAESLRSG